MSLSTQIKQRAHELGFDLVGITTAEPSAFAAEYREWIERDFAGEMGYLTRNIERRLDPRELLKDARSIVVVGMNYYTREEGRGERETDPGLIPRPPSPRGKGEIEGGLTPLPGSGLPPWPPSPRGKGEIGPIGPTSAMHARPAIFARYARGDDYHDVMDKRLRELLEYIKAEGGPDAEGRVYVDTGPVLEREVARKAGLGWFGKNTMLINTRRGSYFFLGEIITNVELAPDTPAVGGCGTCTRCLDACPTGAFVAPFVLDSRRCISYLTIELKGAIPEEFVPAIAETGLIYGCDICQEVCPFNRDRGAGEWGLGVGEDRGAGGWGLGVGEIHGASPTTEPAFRPREITVNSMVEDVLLLTEEEFRVAFKGSPVKRAKHAGLIRNALAALQSPAPRTRPLKEQQ